MPENQNSIKRVIDGEFKTDELRNSGLPNPIIEKVLRNNPNSEESIHIKGSFSLSWPDDKLPNVDFKDMPISDNPMNDPRI